MDKIALLPGFIALLVLNRTGPESAFLNVYLPALMLLPWYVCALPGVPDPSFSQSAMFPIAIAFFWRSRFRWRFSYPDVLVFVFVGWAIASEYINNGFVSAQNISFEATMQGLVAYLLGKEMIGYREREARFARRFVFFLFVICVLSVYEFRFSVNPFKGLIGRFFPGQGGEQAWSTQIRWNLGRITGPFSHAIIAGETIMSGILVNTWLIKTGTWEEYLRRLSLPFTRGKIIAAGLIAGSLMTMSRGPWLGGAFGAVLVAVGVTRNPARSLVRAAVFFVIVGAATWAAAATYTSVSPDTGQMTEEQESAAYRAVLTTRYKEFAFERPVWGWGSGSWPVVPGWLQSITPIYCLR